MTATWRPNAGTDGRVRVAFLATQLGPGGAERQMVYLASALPRERFEPSFILLSGGGDYVDDARRAGIPIHELGLSRLACRRRQPRCLRSVLRAIVAYRALVRSVDIIEAWTVPAYTFAGLVRPIAPVPLVLAGRRSLPGVDRTRTVTRELARDLAMRRVDAIVANSQAAASASIAVEGLDPASVRVIRNAVVPITGTPEARAQQRAAWGFGEEDTVIGCIATMRPLKGHELLLRAIARLRSTHPRLRGVLVGDGSMAGTVRALIDELGLAGSVLIDAGQPDARAVYGAIDIVVQASESEGLPNVILEAASAGRPIVATDVGGTGEIVTSGQDGLLVPSGDLDAMVAAIAALLDDPELAARLAGAARERARAFSTERLAAETVALYLELLEAKGATGRRAAAAGAS